MAVNVGERVAGRYELEELVGEGAMSSVYRARDTELERRVAIKLLHEHHSDDPEYVERFRREARAIARLNHPNIVTVIGRGEWKGRQFIVFEHVPGTSLARILETEGRLSVERALSLAYEVAGGLACAHEAGIVHRDVKPQNILVEVGAAAKVTDFGIARSLEAEEELTQSGTVLGTSDYLAPEQASGERVDERSDQYSLGAMLYELLAGEVPYPAPTMMASALRHLHDPIPSVREHRPDVSPQVDAIVHRALAKRPSDRFPSMEAMGAALQDALREERSAGRAAPEENTVVIPAPRTAPEPRRPAPRASRSRPSRAVVLLAALGGAVLLVGLVAALSDDGGDDGASGSAGTVRMRAVSDFDPEGGDGEHPETVRFATDRDPATFWTTETYRSFVKSGVGIVLDARRPVALSRLVVTSDEPGFTALIRAGSRAAGPFEDVSEEQSVRRRTAFEVDTDGEEYRFYLLWITDLDSLAHVNEARAG
jgi:tRNA A-37 threonylcarbamoyl transferase component Bud32